MAKMPILRAKRWIFVFNTTPFHATLISIIYNRSKRIAIQHSEWLKAAHLSEGLQQVAAGH